MAVTKLFELTERKLSIDDVAARVSRVDCGAIVTFAGTVRGETQTEAGSRGTDFLEYEAYGEMAEAMLARIGAEMQEKWPKVLAVSIVHAWGAAGWVSPCGDRRGDGAPSTAVSRRYICHPAAQGYRADLEAENWSDGRVWVEERASRN